MMETWHPLGVCGVISAFNFPVAVWSWNAALAFVCGDPVVWKPSEKTPLTALATQAIGGRAARRFGEVPEGLRGAADRRTRGRRDPRRGSRVPLVSATGSTAMGRQVGPKLAARFARAILELGGNNAAIVAPSADLDLALRGIAFAAIGTAGQRCTTLRRLFVHESIYDGFVPKLVRVYESVRIGDPRAAGTLVGPLIDAPPSTAWSGRSTRHVGGRHGPWRRALPGRRGGRRPSTQAGPGRDAGARSARAARDLRADPLRHALPPPSTRRSPLHNAVGAGLSSSIFTLDMREAERFISAAGSDCGIANVNIGPRAPRSAAPSAARRRPAAAARPARTPGRPTCAGPPTRSITARPCRSPRA